MVFTDSASIKVVQSAVNAAGYQPALTVDGITGPKTQAGVRWFQQQKGLSVDGLIGPQTMTAAQAQLSGSAVVSILPPPSTIAALTSQLTSLVSAPTPPPAGAVTAPMPPPPSQAAMLAAIAPTPVVIPAVTAPGKPMMPVVMAKSAGSALDQSLGLPAGTAAPLLGGVAGLAVGAFGGLLWMGLGALGGAVVGYAYNKVGPGASMHGEDDLEFCSFDSDYGCDVDDLTVQAGDIGCDSPVVSLRG